MTETHRSCWYCGLMKPHEEFKTEAMKIQGSGWIYLARNGSIKTIKNHEIKTSVQLMFR